MTNDDPVVPDASKKLCFERLAYLVHESRLGLSLSPSIVDATGLRSSCVAQREITSATHTPEPANCPMNIRIRNANFHLLLASMMLYLQHAIFKISFSKRVATAQLYISLWSTANGEDQLSQAHFSRRQVL